MSSCVFSSFTFQTGLKIHNYNTRGCAYLRNSIVKHEFSRTCIRYQLPIVINNTPLIIIDKATTHGITGFTEYIKKVCMNINHISFYSFIISSFALMAPKGRFCRPFVSIWAE